MNSDHPYLVCWLVVGILTGVYAWADALVEQRQTPGQAIGIGLFTGFAWPFLLIWTTADKVRKL